MIGLARDLRGMTQAELAEAMAVNQATISRYESGLSDAPQDHLDAIARILERPCSFFYWQDRLYDASCLYHRKNRRISASELRLIHAKVNLLRLQSSRLRQRAKVTSNYSFHRLDPKKFGGPEGCARELRRLWQLPLGPVRNVVKSIESAGGMVFRCPFGATRVDGISQWPIDSPNLPPVFFVHEEAPGDRERWTLAHEIGHVVMHHALTESDPEDEANRFANEFLMPADDIAHDLSGMTIAKATSLKAYWKVSMQAIIMRAHYLRRTTENQHQYLFRQISVKGYRKCEPLPIPPEEPAMFFGLMDFHYKSLGLSVAEVSECLGETETNFRRLYRNNFAEFRLVS
jgi:Zn-dependent peptidase ImmA (M78 family)/DNA-binding XRE family transcriptional regulator